MPDSATVLRRAGGRAVRRGFPRIGRVARHDSGRGDDRAACAQRARAILRQKLAWAAGYNALTIPLAEFGFVLPWLAALGMAASSTLVIANAMRLSACSFIAIDS